MRPEAYLILAERLLDTDAPEEASCRAAAHLAYYAVYQNSASLFGLDTADRKAGTHGKVMSALRLLNADAHPQLVEAKAVYDRLWDARSRADYRFREVFTEHDARRSVILSRGVFSA